jgi:hypothetical protein
MILEKAKDEPMQSSDGATRSFGAYTHVFFFTGVHLVLTKMGPSDHPMPYFQHILIWA